MIRKLDGIRDRVLTLPVGHKLRIRYRDLRRGCANANEEARYGGNSALLTEIGRSVHEGYDTMNAITTKQAITREQTRLNGKPVQITINTLRALRNSVLARKGHDAIQIINMPEFYPINIVENEIGRHLTSEEGRLLYTGVRSHESIPAYLEGPFHRAYLWKTLIAHLRELVNPACVDFEGVDTKAWLMRFDAYSQTIVTDRHGME
jgi:hypothetical protein